VIDKVGLLNKVETLLICQFMRVVLRHFFTGWHNIRLYCGRRLLAKELHGALLVARARSQH
jgi:hypothetical protein